MSFAVGESLSKVFNSVVITSNTQEMQSWEENITAAGLPNCQNTESLWWNSTWNA